MNVAFAPETVQTPGVLETKPTARPELAVATRLKGPAPGIKSGRLPKEIVCGVPVEFPKRMLRPPTPSRRPLGSAVSVEVSGDQRVGTVSRALVRRGAEVQRSVARSTLTLLPRGWLP